MKKDFFFAFDTSLSPENILDRDFLLQEMKKRVALEESDALEIGVGNGRFIALLADSFASYTGLDPSPKMLELARRFGHPVYEGFAENISIKQSFDVILFLCTFHFTEGEKALVEARKHLKKNGIIVIYEPTTDSAWLSPRLNKESPEFDLKLYQKKCKDLRRAAKVLDEQTALQAEKIYHEEMKYQCWILSE